MRMGNQHVERAYSVPFLHTCLADHRRRISRVGCERAGFLQDG